MNTSDFLLDLARRRRYRLLTPEDVVARASERVAADDSPAVLSLAIVEQPQIEGDQALERSLEELGLTDIDGTLRELEIEAVCEEVRAGTIEPLEGGGRLESLFYEDESDPFLLAAWRTMTGADEPANREAIGQEILALSQRRETERQS